MDNAILSDNHNADKVIGFELNISKTIYDCRKYLNDLGKQYSVLVIGVSEHSDIPFSFRMYNLTRLGMAVRFSDDYSPWELVEYPAKILWELIQHNEWNNNIRA